MGPVATMKSWLEASNLDGRFDFAEAYNDWIGNGGYPVYVILGKPRDSVKGRIVRATSGYLVVKLPGTSLAPINSFRDEILEFSAE